jgi:Rad3-related DNA helicase
MVFFQSHQFLRQVYEQYRAHFWREEEVACIMQEEHMDESAREGFLNRFAGKGPEGSVPEGAALAGLVPEGFRPEGLEAVCMDIDEEDRSLLGFCVAGGIFSEGIDLKNDRLIGVIVVGTGLPQVCPEREILKRYFDDRGESGFDYAYKLPGMNKVLQAAGRVIRTQEDIGIVVLLDERFLQLSYRKLFPREWERYETVKMEEAARQVEKFWHIRGCG